MQCRIKRNIGKQKRNIGKQKKSCSFLMIDVKYRLFVKKRMMYSSVRDALKKIF